MVMVIKNLNSKSNATLSLEQEQEEIIRGMTIYESPFDESFIVDAFGKSRHFEFAFEEVIAGVWVFYDGDFADGEPVDSATNRDTLKRRILEHVAETLLPF